MEKNQIIIESQLRSIIREELEKVLIEEGLAKQFQAALMALTLTFAGHQAAAGMGGKGDAGSGGGETIEQILKKAGMKDDVLRELQSQLTEDDIKLLQSKFQEQKRLHVEYDKAIDDGDYQKVKDIDRQLDNLFAGVSSQTQQRLMKTGQPILQYIGSLSKDQVEQIGNISDKAAIERLQTKALYHQMKPEVQTKNLTNAAVSDLNKIALIAQNDGFKGDTKEELITNWAVNQPNIYQSLPSDFDLVDVIKVTDNDDSYQFNSKLINSNFTDEKVEEFSDSFPKLSKEKLFAGSAEGENVQKENKVEKLKKRLNEIRGLYV